MKVSILLIVCLISVVPCAAEVITVDDDGPADFDNIQAAIDYSTSGDEIVVSPGVYTGSGNRDIDYKGKAITVRSSDPNDPNVVAATIIDCNGTETEPHRGFIFKSDEDANSVLYGLTITNGYARDGGGINCWSENPTILNCVITGNRATYGGGFCYGAGYGVFAEMYFYSELHANYLNIIKAGDYYSIGYDSGGPVFINCVISGNSASNGGGIYVDSGPGCVFTDCEITGNSATLDGGGVYCQWISRPQFNNCEISQNSCYNYGGGMFCHVDSFAKCEGCVIRGNIAQWGAGIGFDKALRGTFSNCVITGNRATESGGGLYWVDSIIEFFNCNIIGNKSLLGGGIYGASGGAYADEQLLTNCVVYNNSADNGSQIALDNFYPPNTDRLIITYCDVEGGEGGIYIVQPYVLTWGDGNIDADPYFVDSGYWDVNGTPGDVNDDFWVEGDYHLLAGSSCIDAGDNNSVPTEVDTDIEGNDRFVDDPTTTDTGNGEPPVVDMGAYEYILRIHNITADIYHRTIQDAIDAASESDEVVVSCGVYTGSGNRDISFAGKAITVRSNKPNDPRVVCKTVIDCMGTEAEPHRGFVFSSGEGLSSKIAGLTIINGYGPEEDWFGTSHSAGGAIFCEGSSPTIENCVLKNNYSDYWGGGIYCFDGDSNIKGCHFIRNEASDTGGGIYNNTSNLVISNCTFCGNSAGYGGGIYSVDTNPTIRNCTFSGNSASSFGGAMRNSRSDVEILNCILWGDSANSGNEMYNSSTAIAVSYSDIQGGWAGVGNIDTDPCFVDPGIDDFHLQSSVGAWCEKSECWICCDSTSSCIDSGDPNSDWSLELWPHGKCVNMGASGGTAQASMSLLDIGNIADLNNDDLVNFKDFADFAENWQLPGLFLAEDLDRNGKVEMSDLGQFADSWLWEQ